jgi:hypothetical protein
MPRQARQHDTLLRSRDQFRIPTIVILRDKRRTNVNGPDRQSDTLRFAATGPPVSPGSRPGRRMTNRDVRSRERIPLRVDEIPCPSFRSPSGNPKGWRAPGSRRAVTPRKKWGRLTGARRGVSGRRSAREGGGHAPRLAWLPLPGKRSQLTTSRPTTRRQPAKPHAGRHIPSPRTRRLMNAPLVPSRDAINMGALQAPGTTIFLAHERGQSTELSPVAGPAAESRASTA